MKIKTGIGIDVHRLEAGREFWLGGIKIGHEKGCVAHSDGDVLIHAICDALLGATKIYVYWNKKANSLFSVRCMTVNFPSPTWCIYPEATRNFTFPV